MSDLLRLVLLSNRPRRMAQRGFVLPTTVLLVLMVVLTATALTYRVVSRSQTSIAQREQVVVASAASPAIDRAKAKIEFLFKGDTRLPPGLPTSAILVSMLRNDGSASIAALTDDPYTLPGEARLDINGDGTLDTAWSFEDRSTTPTRTVVYSILAADQGTSGGTAYTVTSPESLAKARSLVTRTGPLDIEGARPNCPGSVQARDGWFPANPSNSSRLLKNFQINVFMSGGTDAGRTREAFEFQESRAADRLNKWAAWFRTDLEVSPDANFAFNGAMHTDGSLIVGAPSGSNFDAYMVSSQASCVYTADASEITMRQTGDGSTFQGQAMRGTLGTNAGTAGNTNTFHVWNGDNSAPNTSTTLDNLGSVASGVTPENVSLNTANLLDANGVWTNTLQHRGTATRASTWQTNSLRVGVAGKPRIYNDNYIDRLSNVLNLSATSRNGYWEDEAQEKGLRLIVGQRLELGNPIRWNLNPTTGDVTGNIDNLYPPTSSTPSPLPTGVGANEYQQKRSLRDNLAAVQTMAIYRPTGGGMATDGDFPVACYALTNHPGTPQSIVNSRTFGTFAAPTNVTPPLKLNFLNGEGTNGWEFAYHSSFDSAGEFASQIASTNPLGIALRNLAHFAGAPSSATSTQKAYFSMWGDFSKLREVLAKVDGGTAYSALTFEEKSTLHTAACTMSVLAYNIEKDDGERVSGTIPPPSSVQNVTQQGKGAVTAVMQCLARRSISGWADIKGGGDPCKSGGFNADTFLQGLDYVNRDGVTVGKYLDSAGNSNWVDPNPSTVLSFTEANGTTITLCPASGTGSDTAGFQEKCDSAELFETWKLMDWINLLMAPGAISSLNTTDANANGIPDVLDGMIRYAQTITSVGDITRDRDLGFRAGNTTKVSPVFDPNAGSYVERNDEGFIQPVPFGSNANDKRMFKIQCDPNIFQRLGASGGGGIDNVVTAALIVCSEIEEQPVRYPSLYYLFPVVDHSHAGTGYHLQPNGTYEQYGIANYVEEYVGNTTTVNGSFTYKIVGSGVTNGDIVGIKEIAAVPKSTTTTTWILPPATCAGALTTANINDTDRAFCINVGTAGWAGVPILDKGLFDGREQISVRVADIDLATLIANDWIPDGSDSAIVYASREDAVTDETPLDFSPDPKRRPHGFRLRNGADLSKAKARNNGLTFVTNNSAYVMGNFNLHSTDGTFANRIEEFTATLGDNAWTTANFYTNRTNGTLNSNFARTATDTWRPAEILADAITILSGTFKDGAVEDTFRPSTDPKTSYMNQIRPQNTISTVQRASGGTSGSTGSTASVWINRNGNAFVGTTPITSSTWTSANEGQAAGDTYVNATFFSGMAPSRKQQSNGGLLNFVRLTELWAGRTLNIQGAFIQFDFSRMATAPFDHDAWEVGATPGDTQEVGYYSPPTRRWSYDVGLLYQQPGAAAGSFLSLRSPRSEYFRTLPNDDPYITTLRCARRGTNRVFPDEACPA